MAVSREFREILDPSGNKDALIGRRKVAIVLISLGPELASSILRHFDDAEVEQIALEISSMRKAEHNVVNQVLEEFYQLARASA